MVQFKSLEEVEKFVEDNSFDIMTDIVENNGVEVLSLTVAWIESGYNDDEIDKEYKLEELYDMETLLEDANVRIEDGNSWCDERETLLVTLL